MKRAKRLYLWSGILIVACIVTIGIMRLEEYTEQIKESGEVVLSVSSDTVETLSWENEDGTFSFYLNEEDWIYEDDEAFPVDEEIINEMLEVFEELSAAFIIEEVEDYSQYGLDDPVCTITFTASELTYEVQLGSYSQLDEQRYVSLGDGNVYLLNHDPLDEYGAVMEDVIQYDTLLTYDAVTEVRIVNDENYTIIYEEESTNSYSEDDVYFAQLDGESAPLDTDVVEGYFSTIQSLDLTNYVTYNVTEEELETYGLTDPEITISVDCVTLDEDDNESVETFELYVSRHTEDVDIELTDDTEEMRVYIRVGTSSIIYQITIDEYEELLACTYNDFRHLELYTAEFTDITGMDVVIDGETYTITSEVVDDERVYSYLDEEIDTGDIEAAIENLQADSFTDEVSTGESEIAITLYLENENYSEIEIELFRQDGEYCIATINGESVALVERTLMVDLVEAINAIVL